MCSMDALRSRAGLCAGLALIWLAALSAFGPRASQAADPSQPDWVKELTAPMPAPTGPTGAWFPWNNQFSLVRATFTHGGISTADGQAWDAQLRAIVDMLKNAPVMAGPAGFFPEPVGHIGVLDAGGFVDRPKQAPLVGGVSVAAWPPRNVEMDAQGRPRLVKGAHIRHFRLELNYVYPPKGDAWMTDALGDFGPLVKQGEFAGFPLYGNSLVVTKERRLPFAPVSQQRALEAFITHHEKSVAGFEATLAARRRKTYDDFVSPEGVARRRAEIEAQVAKAHPTAAEQTRRQVEAIDRRREQDLLAEANQGPSPTAKAVAEARARLAGFSEADRQAPAWLLPSRGRTVLEIVRANTPGASPLVSFDASFFDPKQPRHTLRIALVRELHNIVDGAQHATASDQISLQLLRQIDWQGFAEKFLR